MGNPILFSQEFLVGQVAQYTLIEDISPFISTILLQGI